MNLWVSYKAVNFSIVENTGIVASSTCFSAENKRAAYAQYCNRAALT
jgi:hypothetical protein